MPAGHRNSGVDRRSSAARFIGQAAAAPPQAIRAVPCLDSARLTTLRWFGARMYRIVTRLNNNKRYPDNYYTLLYFPTKA